MLFASRSGDNIPGFYLHHVEVADQDPASGTYAKNFTSVPIWLKEIKASMFLKTLNLY